jgi:hypothetical protein
MKHRHRRRRTRLTQVTLSPETKAWLGEMLPDFNREFRERFGRDIGPRDPLFWSPDRSGPEPEPMTEEEIEQIIWAAMEKAGFDPATRRLNEHIRLKPVS